MSAREVFEIWYQENITGCNGEWIEVDEHGQYLERSTRDAWKLYQIGAKHERDACASICDRFVYAIDNGGNRYKRPAMADQCANAIRARSNP